MAQKFLTSIDLNLNELQNAKLHVLAAAPTGVKGLMYFSSATNLPYWYNGSSWVTFATSSQYDTLNAALTTLQGYFTGGIANQAAKVTNALSFAAGKFSSLDSYDGSAARTLNIPTKTSHLTEETNLFFTDARVWNTMTGSTTTSLTASRVVVTNASGKLAASSTITTTELAYLDGLTSAVQTQLDDKLSKSKGGTVNDWVNFNAGINVSELWLLEGSWGINSIGSASFNSLSIENADEEQQASISSSGIAKFKSLDIFKEVAVSNASIDSDGNAYFDGTLQVNGASTLGGNVTVTGNIIPSANGTYNLGGSSNYWNYLYAKYGVIGTGGLSVNGNITAKALRRYDGATPNANALVQAVSNNTDITLFRVNHDTTERYSTSASYGYSLFYKGSDTQNRLYLMADNSTATAQSIALCVFQTGNVGIKGEANSNYALTVNGKFYATGESLFASTIVANGNIRLGAGKKLYGTKTDGTTAINLIEFTDTSMTINGAALATTSINSATTSVKALTATSITIGNVVIKEDSDGILKFFYKGDENGETNVATIYATGGVSALGLGVSSGGSGGGGIVETVWTYDNLIGTTLSEELTTDVASAWAVKKIYNRTNDNATNIASINSKITNIESTYATQSYVNTAISDLIGGAPSTLDTLKELADAMTANKDAIDALEAIAGGKVSSVTVTGTGNAVTSASVSTSGVLTLTKGTAFLTSHQTIHSLTIKNSAGTTQLTYTPNSAAGSITLTKAMVGLGNVENTALSTWTGSSKITTLGTITTGTWNGTKITNDYINSVEWSKLTSKPTKISGYGITDAYTKTEVDSLVADSSHTVKRHSATITGDASATSFTITHSLNTTDVMVFTRDESTKATNGYYQQVYCDIYIKDANNIIVTFASAPATGTKYRVTVLA